ncbi:DUF6221 family protein [Streptomyces sp. NPDC057910]|uniref:DUF6221 family protein n=1 Tax=Streptomyces sp. NPDC057910 TaxID=3346278 RepID=UPI0036EEC8A4
MPDLHTWITAQVDRAETIARNASAWGADWYHDDLLGEVRDYGNGNTITWASLPTYGRHVVANDPAAVLRRCAADRRILARHRAAPDDTDTMKDRTCQACNYYNRIGMMPIRLAVDLADCPELLDLARAHGITDEVLASLDRPRRSPIEAWARNPYTAVADVPASLRGPSWKAANR